MEKSYVLIEYLIKHAISFFNFIPKYIEFHQDRSQKWVQ